MTRLFRGLALAAAVLGGGLLAAAPARASEPGVLKVDDEAGLFSPDGVAKAKQAFEGTAFKSKTNFTVHTVAKIPSAKQSEFDAAKGDANSRGRFFSEWARELARKEGRKADVYALIFDNGKAYITRVITDRETDVGRGFTDANAGEVAHKFEAGLKRVFSDKLTGDATKKEMDAALASAATYVADELKNAATPEPAARRTGRVAADAGNGGGGGIMSWICVGLAVLLGVWLVVGLIRAFTGGGGGGGYGPGGGYGGGGGGFFSSMLGGLFGAAAGMYLYDNFFGGHHGGGMSEAAAADNGGTIDTGDGDYGGGAEGGDAGGGDWGDSGAADAGGGDWGAGGGDFGGGGDWGGDAGGGGDFGGGGDW